MWMGKVRKMKLLHFDFPREVGLFRKVVHNQRELEDYWSSLNNAVCAYTSVYGFRGLKPSARRAEYNTAVVRHFVIDFDCKARQSGTVIDVSGDSVLDEVRRLHQMLMEKNIHHAVWFSGNGFHVWIRLSEVHHPSNGRDVSLLKAAGKKVVRSWAKSLGLRCIDPTVPFDMARLIRIPNSYNAKQHVGRWSIPLTHEDITMSSWDDICESAEHPREGLSSHGENGVDLPIEQVHQQRFKSEAPAVHFETISMDGIKILPCLMEAACQVGSNPPHDARVSLAIYLASRLRNFLPVERTTPQSRDKAVDRMCEFIESLSWADYDPSVTRYQVTSVVERGYEEHCASLCDKGLCLGKCQLWDGTGAIR
jgi:hypothetical protein